MSQIELETDSPGEREGGGGISKVVHYCIVTII